MRGGARQNKLSIFLQEYDKGLRCLTLYLVNPNLDDHLILLKSIFNTITTYQPFIEFGSIKSIIVSAVMYKDITFSGSTEYNFHHNVLIDLNTTFMDYYNQVGEFVNHKLEHGYGYEVIQYYKIRIWNLDNMKNARIKLLNKGQTQFLGYRSYSTTSKTLTVKNNLSISPIKKDKDKSSFSTMDIETMNINGIQTPVAISCCNSTTSKLFIIDYILLKINLELAVTKLWDQYFDYINKVGDNLIFAHNLGSFDGYFLYKALINKFDPQLVECIIDEAKTFISITLIGGSSCKIVWKDSFRIFPVSLDSLCNTFSVEGKLNKYDSRFNDVSLFNKPTIFNLFKKYALGSTALMSPSKAIGFPIGILTLAIIVGYKAFTSYPYIFSGLPVSGELLCGIKTSTAPPEYDCLISLSTLSNI